MPGDKFYCVAQLCSLSSDMYQLHIHVYLARQYEDALESCACLLRWKISAKLSKHTVRSDKVMGVDNNVKDDNAVQGRVHRPDAAEMLFDTITHQAVHLHTCRWLVMVTI